MPAAIESRPISPEIGKALITPLFPQPNLQTIPSIENGLAPLESFDFDSILNNASTPITFHEAQAVVQLKIAEKVGGEGTVVIFSDSGQVEEIKTEKEDDRYTHTQRQIQANLRLYNFVRQDLVAPAAQQMMMACAPGHPHGKTSSNGFSEISTFSSALKDAGSKEHGHGHTECKKCGGEGCPSCPASSEALAQAA